MKSVLFVNYEYPPVGGGAATATYHFAAGFASRNIQTTVLTSAYKDKRGSSIDNKVTVQRIAALRTRKEKSSILQMLFFMISATFNLSKVINKSNPDIIITFFSIPCGPIGLLGRLFWSIPYVVMLRGGDVPGSEQKMQLYHKLLKPLRRMIYKKSLMILANSNGLKRIAEKADPGFTIDVIPNGVDTEYFSPGKEKNYDKIKRFTFLFVGRLCAQKNISVLIRAFSECVLDYPEIQLIIAGDGPDLNQLKLFACKYGCDRKIQWAGWQTKEFIRSLYRESDCLVNPSLNEGLPNVVLEAMACGLPVIASDCAGNNDLVIDGQNGFLFPADNYTGLCSIMRSLLNKSELCVTLGMRGREMSCKQYSWESVTTEFQSVLISEK